MKPVLPYSEPYPEDARLALAGHMAANSSDPSTKVGAAVFTRTGRLAGVGFNRFPPGVVQSEDRLHDRPRKYRFTVHAEQAALIAALQTSDIEGGTLYSSHYPCVECCKLIAEAGIRRIVCERTDADRFMHEDTTQLLAEAGIEVRIR